jgi:glycosyltransferase involved in cell wall biosynthesis
MTTEHDPALKERDTNLTQAAQGIPTNASGKTRPAEAEGDDRRSGGSSVNPLRVVHVINGLGTGGAERSLAEMLPILMEHGVEPIITCFHHRPEGVHQQIASLGVQIEVFGGASPAAHMLSLRRILVRMRADLVHTSIFKSNILGRVAAAGTGIPVLTSLINTPYEKVVLTTDPNIRPHRYRLAQQIDRHTARGLSTWFHAITHAVRDSAVETLGLDPRRITVIERGRNVKRMGEFDEGRRAKVRRDLGLGSDAEVILNVGRQEYQKGQRFLIEAADRILDLHPRAVLLIAGRVGGATAELLAAHAALHHRDRVRFLGHREDVPELLCAADVFVFPSLFEGLGGAVIEAMALGLPIVASRLPAIREVVDEGRNAVLLEPARSDLIVEALDALLRSPTQRARFGHHGRATFSQRFTLEPITLRMLDLFRNVADMRERRWHSSGVSRPSSREL